MSKILIIEDDEKILTLERDYLEANGFETDTAVDGLTGLEKALGDDFALVLLDIMLPSMSGIDVCRKIREKKDIPILMVSAKKEEPDKIEALGFGADDYIVKPFSPGELVARIKAHIARYNRLTGSSVTESDVITIDNLRIDKQSAQAFLNGTDLALTKKEFNVLLLMASQPTKVFTKNEIFETVWGYDSLGDTSSLTVHINRLRDKIKKVDPESNYIKTMWGMGYRFK
ncbi:MAG: response regulator transcription factor [Clostridiales bacterium]|nr:response regulator transcription factor [Clostridiales bacterium]